MKKVFPLNFVISNYKMYFKVHIIFERPFLFMGHASIDVKSEDLNFLMNDNVVIPNTYKSMKKTNDSHVISMIDNID